MFTVSWPTQTVLALGCVIHTSLLQRSTIKRKNSCNSTQLISRKAYLLITVCLLDTQAMVASRVVQLFELPDALQQDTPNDTTLSGTDALQQDTPNDTTLSGSERRPFQQGGQYVRSMSLVWVWAGAYLWSSLVWANFITLFMLAEHGPNCQPRHSSHETAKTHRLLL